MAARNVRRAGPTEHYEMAAPDDALTLVARAESAGELSPSAASQHQALALRTAVRHLPRPIGGGRPGRPVEGSRRCLLRCPRIRDRRPPGQDVSGRNQRPQRSDDGRIAPGGWPTTSPRPKVPVRPGPRAHRPRHPAQLARIRRSLRPSPGGGRASRSTSSRTIRSTPLLSFAVRHLAATAGS